ncbi:MAG: peptidase S24 [Clostridia bacterium]|nr:peptidase S24 [Clostridia bacterium]
MMPLLKPQRDIVWLEQCDMRQIKKGDILLFERGNGKPVLHRVRKIENDVLIMNGDALYWTEPIEKTQVIACVKKFERNKKMFTCESKKIKLWNMIWYITRPVRLVLRRLYSALRIKKR